LVAPAVAPVNWVEEMLCMSLGGPGSEKSVWVTVMISGGAAPPVSFWTSPPTIRFAPMSMFATPGLLVVAFRPTTL
jgi:hypothetical protein